MKISNTLLALCAINGASAFVVQPQVATTSALNSFAPQAGLRDSVGYDMRTNDGPANPLVHGKTGHGSPMERAAGRDMDRGRDIWDTSTPITVQGGSLRTWSTPSAERVQVLLKTEGRPLNANVELWHGPDNTPQKMNVYIEDGSVRPFSAVIETPRGHNAIAIRNTGQMEFPMTAAVIDDLDGSSPGLDALTGPSSDMKIIQGGAIHTYSFAASVASVACLLKTDGRPLNARIELLQGPNNNKQVLEVYCEDGMERPFFVVLETPGSGNVVRVVNTSTMEFPVSASVEPYIIDENRERNGAQGWDNGGATSTANAWDGGGGNTRW